MQDTPIRLGVIADQTGDLAFMGIADANVATMVIEEINASGGLLGRPLEMILEDDGTDDEQAARVAAKLVQEDHVDVVLGGIHSSTRQAIKGPVVVDGKTLYIYPEQYEGQECDPLLFCTGPVPAQQVEPLIPWLMERTGAKTFFLPSADYIWPHVLNKAVHEAAEAADKGQNVFAPVRSISHQIGGSAPPAPEPVRKQTVTLLPLVLLGVNVEGLAVSTTTGPLVRAVMPPQDHVNMTSWTTWRGAGRLPQGSSRDPHRAAPLTIHHQHSCDTMNTKV